ncbi:hypothetical protein Cantr_01796 [Candida viswanathii]|uniref:Membrane protein PTM1 n=1 Tax=Candida viswanathii TaxID=5486 RepID=A0A367YM58_9ASCO|nr:hypothetical protein Cantr_01796 [Candida viswanathii]
MKLFHAALLAAAQSQLAFSFIHNRIDAFEFSDVTPYKCWKFDNIHGETHFKFDVTQIQLGQALPLNVHVNVELMHLDRDQGQEDFSIQRDAYTVFETEIREKDAFDVLIEQPGEFCVLFNENSQYHGPFSANFEIVEKIEPIRISQEVFNHRVTALIGALVIAGLVAKYNIRDLKDMSPISRRLFVLVVLHFIYNVVLCFIPNPARSVLFQNTVGSLLRCWDTYVAIMVYFGSGFKNLGYRVPSNTAWIKRMIMAALVITTTVSTSVLSNSVVKKNIMLEGELQEVYLHKYNGPFILHPYLESLVNGVVSVLGVALLICVTVLPFVYGIVIYNRFGKSGEFVNQELMKKTLLFHGIYAWFVGSVLYYYFDFMKLFEDYVPVVILFVIWFSERPYVAMKGFEDFGSLNGIKEFYL